MNKCEICKKKVIVSKSGKDAGFCFYSGFEFYLCKEHYQEWLKVAKKYTKKMLLSLLDKGFEKDIQSMHCRFLEGKLMEWILQKRGLLKVSANAVQKNERSDDIDLLKDTKRKLYNLLLKLPTHKLTGNEFDIVYSLLKDKDIRNILEKAKAEVDDKEVTK